MCSRNMRGIHQGLRPYLQLLHEAGEAPEGLRLIAHHAEQRRSQVRHALHANRTPVTVQIVNALLSADSQLKNHC